MNANWDVIVVGAGPAGCFAAVAAAQAGLRTLLVERYGFAGGMATAALVNPYAGNCYVNPDTGRAGDIAGGMFQDLLAGLRRRSAVERCLFRPDRPGFYDAFDENELRLLLDELLAGAGVATLYHATLLGVERSGGRIAAIRVLTKGGEHRLAGRHFIDATGDGDLAAAAGAPFDVGRPGDGLCQPCSTLFRMAGVDKPALLAAGLRAARERVSELFSRAIEAGRLEFPFKSWVQFYDYPRPGAIHFNATRVFRLSGLDAAELAEAEREGRRQVRVLSDWLVGEVPWFAGAFIAAVGAQVGVRESRRIRGRRQLTGEDIRSGARFPDGVARSGYFIDIHDPTSSADPHAPAGVPGPACASFTPRRYYEIPFGCLQPQGLGNLLVACRAISTTFEAHASTRVMATMHGVGEAAGRAAAIAAARGIDLAEVDGAEVRKQLPWLDGPLGF